MEKEKKKKHRVSTIGWKLEKHHKEKKSTEPSLTVPDDTMSLQELLDRAARGMVDSRQKVGLYPEENPDFDDIDLSKVNDMDYVDRMELSIQNREAIKVHEQKVQKMREDNKLRRDEEQKDLEQWKAERKKLRSRKESDELDGQEQSDESEATSAKSGAKKPSARL